MSLIAINLISNEKKEKTIMNGERGETHVWLMYFHKKTTNIYKSMEHVG